LKRSFGSRCPKRRPFQSLGFKTTVKAESISKAVAAVDDVDYSAAETLRSLFGILKEKGIRLVEAQVLDDVKAESRYHLSQLFGEEAFYETLGDIANGLRQQRGGEV
jgi:hypothetical protein